MERSMSIRQSLALAKAIAVLSASSLVGCATTPGYRAPSSTPYKGDAVWNIASIAAKPTSPGIS